MGQLPQKEKNSDTIIVNLALNPWHISCFMCQRSLHQTNDKVSLAKFNRTISFSSILVTINPLVHDVFSIQSVYLPEDFFVPH